MSGSVKCTELENGFKIVTENMPGLKSASLGIWVKAGTRDERFEQNGIAHFLEHMAFKGTKTRSALQIAEEIENVGGYINAYTSREMTAYYVRILEEDVRLGFDVISDIVLNSIFDKDELETERGVILQEIGQSLDTPDDIIFDWLQERAYPDQPMGRPILGPSDHIRKFSKSDFENFIGEHYAPDRMVLAAVGSVDHNMLVALATEIFGGIKPQELKSNEGANFIGGEAREVKDLEQAHFALAFEAPSYLVDDVYTGQLYSAIMGGGLSSRLFQEAREKRGLCYTIYASAAAFRDSGMLTIYAGTSGDDIAGLSQLTVDELKRSVETMTQIELDRARAQMKAGLLMGLENASSRCERIARLSLIFGHVPTLEDVVAKIDRVSLDDLSTLASGFIKQKPALALYGPVSKAPSIDQLVKQLAA